MTITSKIEWAFGADLTANPATWVWTDLSLFALGSVRRTFGRLDEASQTQPASVTFRLRNTDGRFSPRFPTSPHYPNVRRQTPVRISLDPGTGYVQRFQGYIDDIVPSWPAGNSSSAEVLVTASGSLRRLGQGRSPFKSPLYRALSAASPFAYWPLEDGPQADRIAATAGGGAVSLVRLMATGPAEFGAVRPPTGATAMPSFIRGGALDLQVSSRVASAWTVELALFFGTGEPAPADYSTPNAMNVFKLYARNGDYWELQLSPHNSFFTGGRVALFRSDEPENFFDTLVDTPIGSFNPWDGRTHHAAVTAAQSGGNIVWQLILDGSVYGSGTLASRTLQPVDLIRLNQNGFLASSSTYGLGHVAVFESVVSVTAHASAAAGWSGELVTDRLTRLCAEQGVSLALSGTSTITMGPQGTGTFLNLLRECEAADSGILYDGQGPGLAYRTSRARMNVPVAMALDCRRQQVKLPFAPAEDDQRIRNDWTVSRPGGSFVRQANADHIAANGLYDDSANVNVATDSMLSDQASWRVHLGTVEEMRVPGIALQLIDHPELWTSWLGMTLSDRLAVANLPSQYPPGVLDAILEGGVEVWDATSLKVDVNTSPYAPWNVQVLDSDRRLDCGASTTTSSFSTTATSVPVVYADACSWTHSRGDYDVVIGGESMTVKAVGDVLDDVFGRTASNGWGTADTGQVWTTNGGSAADYSVSAGLGRISQGSVNVLRHVTAPVDWTDIDVNVDVSWAIGAAAGASATAWLIAGDDPSNLYAARLELTTSGTITLALLIRTGGLLSFIPGASASAGAHSAGNTWRLRLRKTGTTLLGTTSNITAGGATTQVSGTDTDPGLSTGGSIVGVIGRLESGNTNTPPVVLTFDNLNVTNPQTFTVVRSVNGVVKAHAAGEEVHVANPIILAL